MSTDIDSQHATHFDHLDSFDPEAIARDGLVHYEGDGCPIPHGGAWIDLSTYHQGYACALRITPLGDREQDGGFYLERLTIHGMDNPETVAAALECIGLRIEDVEAFDHAGRRALAIASALLQYGSYDPDDEPFGPASCRAYTVIEYCDDPEDPMPFAHGWGESSVVSESDLEQIITHEVSRVLCQDTGSVDAEGWPCVDDE